MKLKRWRVTFTAWRETWSGHDQNDGPRECFVRAKTRRGAISKADEKYFGGNWSHSIWGTDWEAEEA